MSIPTQSDMQRAFELLLIVIVTIGYDVKGSDAEGYRVVPASLGHEFEVAGVVGFEEVLVALDKVRVSYSRPIDV